MVYVRPAILALPGAGYRVNGVTHAGWSYAIYANKFNLPNKTFKLLRLIGSPVL